MCVCVCVCDALFDLSFSVLQQNTSLEAIVQVSFCLWSCGVNCDLVLLWFTLCTLRQKTWTDLLIRFKSFQRKEIFGALRIVS